VCSTKANASAAWPSLGVPSGCQYFEHDATLNFWHGGLAQIKSGCPYSETSSIALSVCMSLWSVASNCLSNSKLITVWPASSKALVDDPVPAKKS